MTFHPIKFDVLFVVILYILNRFFTLALRLSEGFLVEGGLRYPPCFKFDMFVMLI
jgi:hypothetical protein